jgi:hypothetical protein
VLLFLLYTAQCFSRFFPCTAHNAQPRRISRLISDFPHHACLQYTAFIASIYHIHRIGVPCCARQPAMESTTIDRRATILIIISALVSLLVPVDATLFRAICIELLHVAPIVIAIQSRSTWSRHSVSREDNRNSNSDSIRPLNLEPRSLARQRMFVVCGVTGLFGVIKPLERLVKMSCKSSCSCDQSTEHMLGISFKIVVFFAEITVMRKLVLGSTSTSATAASHGDVTDNVLKE